MQRAHLLWSAFQVIAAEGNQPEINPFHVVTRITVQWNVILTLGVRGTCNQARVMLFKWHHFVRFQLAHATGGFMMTGAWVKPLSRGYQNGVASMNQSTIPSLLIIEFRWSSQELINRSLVEVWASDVEIWWSFNFYASSYNSGSLYPAIMIKV